MTAHGRAWRGALCVSLAAALSLAACTGREGTQVVIGPGGTGGGTDTVRTGVLVGRWSRTIVFRDATGDVQSSETIWDFRAGGSALRTVVTRNVSGGLADASTAVASWFLQGRTVIISFASPAGGTVRFDYEIFGDTLVLGGLDFVRVRP